MDLDYQEVESHIKKLYDDSKNIVENNVFLNQLLQRKNDSLPSRIRALT